MPSYIKTGSLQKKGELTARAVSRFYALADDGVLHYRDTAFDVTSGELPPLKKSSTLSSMKASAKSKAEKGQISGWTRVSSEPAGRMFAVVIVTPAKTHRLMSDSQDDADSWVDALSKFTIDEGGAEASSDAAAEKGDQAKIDVAMAALQAWGEGKYSGEKAEEEMAKQWQADGVILCKNEYEFANTDGFKRYEGLANLVSFIEFLSTIEWKDLQWEPAGVQGDVVKLKSTYKATVNATGKSFTTESDIVDVTIADSKIAEWAWMLSDAASADEAFLADPEPMPQREGLLHKRGAINKAYKERRFELKDGKLSYYDTSAGKLKGTITLDPEWKVNVISEGNPNYDAKNLYELELVPSANHRSQRIYRLKANSEILQKAWAKDISDTLPLIAVESLDASEPDLLSDEETAKPTPVAATDDDAAPAPAPAPAAEADDSKADDPSPTPVGIQATGFGFSANEDLNAAVSEAIASAGVDKATFAFVSCTVAQDPAAVAAAFAAALPNSADVHGVTSSGAILKAGGAEAGVACLLIEAPGAMFSTSAPTAAEAASQLKDRLLFSKPSAIIMGTTPGAEEGALKAIASVFGEDVPVYGGTAADNELNGSWRVLTRDGALSEGVSLVGVLAGEKSPANIKFGASMLGPYTPTEKTVTVDKAEGRKITTLGGQPAADWMYEWLGDAVKEQYENGGLVLPQTAQKPIGIKQPNGEYVTAHVAGLGGEDKTVDLFTPVADGDELCVMDSGDGPATGYAKTLSEAFDVAKAAGGISSPKAGLLFYCGGMAIAVGDQLGSALNDEAFNTRVEGLPMLGMTVFGEQTRLEGVGNVQRNLSLGMCLFE